jgi:hypothetical protein
MHRLAPLCLVAVVCLLAHCGQADGEREARSHADSVGGVIDVTAPPYNARPGVDAYPAIQAAINASCAGTPKIPVYIPEGIYPLSQSLLVDCATEVFGGSRQGTVLKASFNGPVILVEASGVSLATGPALVGSGSSLTSTARSPDVLNFRDVPAVELNGLTAFTAEAFVDVTTFAGAFNLATIVASSGGLGTGQVAIANAFNLGLYGANVFFGSLFVGGNQVRVSAPTSPALNTVYHLALTYDGATVRLFVNGSVVASAAATGTVQQQVYEDVPIGVTGWGLEGQSANSSVAGSIDSVRLSNVARYTAAFTPPSAKLQPDANTLILENFEPSPPGVSKVWSGTTPYFIPIRAGSGTATLHNLTLEGEMGVFAPGAANSSFYQMDCLDCDYGFMVTGTASGYDRLNDLFVSAGSSRGRYGVFSWNQRAAEFHDLVLDGQQLPFVVNGAGEVDIVNNVTVSPSDNTVFGAIFVHDDPVIDGLNIGVGGAAYRGGLFLAGPSAHPVVVNGSIAAEAGRVRRPGPPAAAATGSAATRSVPPIWVDSAGSLYPAEVAPIVEDVAFVATGGNPAMVDLNYTPASSNSGSVLMDLAIDSSAAATNDPNAITMASPGTPTDPAAIPPMDPGSLPVTSGAIGPGVFPVEAYGASTTATNSYAGIQAAVNAACAQGGGTVLFSLGTYTVGQAVQVNCDLELDGVTAMGSLVQTGQGPSFLLNPPGMTGIDVGPALVGTGNSMRTNGDSYWVDLGHQLVAGLLNGKGASTDTTGFTGFTVEAFVKMTNVTPGYAGIVQSAGCLGTPGGTLPGCTAAFELGAQSGSLYGSLDLGGTPYTLNGPALSLNAVHHVALAYDGVQSIRLFLDGAVAATASPATASAAISQQSAENVSIGPEVTGFYGAARGPAISGYIDAIRISNIARYSGPFTVPTSKPVTDSHIVALANFATNVGGITIGSFGFPVVRTAEPDGTPEKTVSVTMRNLGLSGPGYGVFGVNAADSKFQNIYSQAYSGILLTGDSSGTLFDNVSLVPGLLGLLVTNGTHAVFNNVSSLGGLIPLVINGGTNVQVTAFSETRAAAGAAYEMYFVHSDVRLTGVNILDNLFAGAAWQGFIVVDHPTAPFEFYKGLVGTTNTTGTKAAITIDGGQGYILEGVHFSNSKNDNEIIHVNAPLASGAHHMAIGVHYDTGSTLSDDPAIQVIAAAGH